MKTSPLPLPPLPSIACPPRDAFHDHFRQEATILLSLEVNSLLFEIQFFFFLDFRFKFLIKKKKKNILVF